MSKFNHPLSREGKSGKGGRHMGKVAAFKEKNIVDVDLIDINDYIDNSCNQCNATMINDIFCHEVGCPNQNKLKFDGKWITCDEENNPDDYGYEEYRFKD